MSVLFLDVEALSTAMDSPREGDHGALRCCPLTSLRMAISNEDPAELIARMLTSYSIASSYADRGTATAYVGRVRVEFQTSFVRGRQFRFEYRNERGRRVIWSDGTHTYTYERPAMDRTRIIDDGADIALAIGAATGVSSGTAHTVPAMLLPVSIGAGSFSLAQLGELRSDGIEYIGSCLCERVNGSTQGGELTTLWINRETYLLRRIIMNRGSRFETTTSYEPSLAPIDVGWIERPDIEKTPPQPRGPVPWTGIHLADDSRRVEEIDQGSPAMRSGLAIGDEVEVVNGQRTDGYIDFVRASYAVKIGEHLALTVRRGGNTVEVLVQVEAHPREPRAAPSAPLVE